MSNEAIRRKLRDLVVVNRIGYESPTGMIEVRGTLSISCSRGATQKQLQDMHGDPERFLSEVEEEMRERVVDSLMELLEADG